jgi:O-antigen/teichoic acid export membrane protein
MANLKQAWSRLSQSAVAWSWITNGLRLTSGMVVLPLLLFKLSKPDYDMYIVFLSLAGLGPVLDLGFSVSIGRAVGYAMGGAKELKAHGFVPEQGASGPNYSLLWQLLHATRQLYRILSLVTLVALGALGTVMIAKAVGETSSPRITWAAWALTLISTLWEIYAGWWNVFLRSMNQVLASMQQLVLAQAVKIVLSCALLLAGGGLLSVPVASIVANLLQRQLARRQVLKLLGTPDLPTMAGAARSLIVTLWPNSWRAGVHFLSSFLAGQANTLICLSLLGLAASGQYGFSLQLIGISSGMAQVWTYVKWPLIGQLRIKEDQAALRRLLWPRLWLQYLTYSVMVLGVVVVVPALLRWHHSDKSLLPTLWLALLALNGFLDMNCVFWNTLISTENRLPMVWPMLVSNVINALLVITLVKFADAGLAVFVLSPLIVGLLFNYWKWPHEGARSIGVSWLRFLLKRQS